MSACVLRSYRLRSRPGAVAETPRRLRVPLDARAMRLDDCATCLNSGATHLDSRGTGLFAVHGVKTDVRAVEAAKQGIFTAAQGICSATEGAGRSMLELERCERGRDYWGMLRPLISSYR